MKSSVLAAAMPADTYLGGWVAEPVTIQAPEADPFGRIHEITFTFTFTFLFSFPFLFWVFPKI